MIVCLCSNLNKQAIREKVSEIRKRDPDVTPEGMLGDPAIHIRCGGCREELVKVIKEILDEPS